MKQPYSCWKEVPEGVRWDRKRSPEPNLHVCGEDGIKRAVYNMKGKHAEKKNQNIERNKEKTQEENLERKELYLFQRKTDCYISSDPSINVRLNLFTFTEVNLVLEHPRSTNYIV